VGNSNEPSVPSMGPLPHVPNSTYRDASHIQSSRSRGTSTPPFPYDQDPRPVSSSTSTQWRGKPSTERPYSVEAKPVTASSADHPSESSRLRRTPSQPGRRTNTHLVTKLDPSINPDSGEVYRPSFRSRDQARPSHSQSCFRGRRSGTGIKGVKVKIIESPKAYTVIDPRLPRKKPKRTELSTPRLGREDQFTDFAFEFWEEDVERARGAASDARSRAEYLHGYLQCN
jgi:hypothetical protein